MNNAITCLVEPQTLLLDTFQRCWNFRALEFIFMLRLLDLQFLESCILMKSVFNYNNLYSSINLTDYFYNYSTQKASKNWWKTLYCPVEFFLSKGTSLLTATLLKESSTTCLYDTFFISLAKKNFWDNTPWILNQLTNCVKALTLIKETENWFPFSLEAPTEKFLTINSSQAWIQWL